MGYDIKQSQTTQPLVFLLVSSTDHITGLTGATVTVTLSKNGGTFASPSGAVSEIGSGWYKVAGNATDANTLGPLLLHATATGADPTDDRFGVVAYDPLVTSMGLSLAKTTNITGFNDIAATAIVSSGAITTSSGAVSSVGTVGSVTGAVGSVTAGVTVATNNDKTGYSLGTAPPTAVQIRTEMDANSTKLANLDATISSRMATFTLPTNFSVLAITASTGKVTVGTNSDKTGYSISGTKTTLDALHDYDGSDTSGTTSLLARLTTTRAGYLDNLSAGAVATASALASVATDAGTAATQSTAANTAAGAVKVVTDKLATALQPDGGSGYQYTTTALANTPVGSGGGLDAAGVRSAIGLASANLDTQLAGLSTFDAASDTVTVGTVNDKTGYALTSAYDAAKTAAQVGSAMTFTTSQLLGTPRDISAVADSAITINDALWSAVGEMGGKETTVGTTYTKKTPSTGTTLRIFTLDDAASPTSRV